MTLRRCPPLVPAGFFTLSLLLSAPSAVADGERAAPGAPTGTGEAAPSDVRIEQARQAFVLGATLASQQQWADALTAFERSGKLRPHPVTTYNVAFCERALGHYTRSYKLFRASLAEHEAQTGGTLQDDLLALARSYVPELERRVARAEVRLEPDKAAISVDGRPLEEATPGASPVVLLAGTREALGSEAPPALRFTLMIDPGRHLFVVSREGEPDRVTTETFEAGATRELLLDTTPRKPTPSATPPAAADTRPETGSRVPAYVAYGVGGVGLVVGALFGVAAVGKKSTLVDHCPTRSSCDARYQDDIDALNRDATLSTVGFAVALVGAGVGTYFLLSSSPSSTATHGNAPIVHAWVGASGIGALATF